MDFLKLISMLITMSGIICVFDARSLTKKLFSFGDQNEGTLGLKISGLFITIVRGINLFVNN